MQHTSLSAPNPNQPYPIAGQPRVGFLKPLVKSPLISVGDFTYYDDPEGPEQFEQRNVLYHFDFLGDRLIIGKFCAIATGATFIMNGANHALDGISTYPFAAMGGDWQQDFDLASYQDPSRGDTIIGDDVWIGRQATILPGINIGSGSIIAAGALVSRDVPAYGVVAGNPANLVKLRFSETDIDRLMALSWWDWPIAMITHYRPLIQNADIDALEEASKSLSQWR